MLDTQLHQERMDRVLRALSRSTRLNRRLDTASSKLVVPSGGPDTHHASRPRTLVEKSRYDR